MVLSSPTPQLCVWNEKVLCYCWWHSLMLLKAILKTFFLKKECGYISPWQALIGGKPIHLSADCQLLGLAMPYQLYLRLLDDALKQGI